MVINWTKTDDHRYSDYLEQYEYRRHQLNGFFWVTTANLIVLSCEAAWHCWWHYALIPAFFYVIYMASLGSYFESHNKKHSIYNRIFNGMLTRANLFESPDYSDAFKVYSPDDVIYVSVGSKFAVSKYYYLDCDSVRVELPRRWGYHTPSVYGDKKILRLRNMFNRKTEYEVSEWTDLCSQCVIWQRAYFKGRKSVRNIWDKLIFKIQLDGKKILAVRNKYGNYKWVYNESYIKSKPARMKRYRVYRFIFSLVCFIYSLMPLGLLLYNYWTNEISGKSEDLEWSYDSEAYENRKALYEALSDDYDWDSYEDFDWWLSKEQNRRRLYKATVNDYDYGSYSEFSESLGY